MNESDSQRIALFLENKGYKSAKDMNSADLIIINACSVRQTAIDRIFGLKPKFKKLKAKTILTGCVLKQDKKKFKEFFDEILTIKELLGENYLKLKSKSVFVPIMTGCNNFCSYCVVPYTRGREKSRPMNEILKEIKCLIKQGHKKITLLGQNVNSYKYGFSNLLKKINSIPGDFKIYFLTNHPKDMSDELINTIAKSKKIAKEIHLPIQSGDDEILKKMNRKYTKKQYLNLIKKIKQKIPNVKISTDAIVGFPGETKKQFQNTVKIFKQVNYNTAYINKYSPRQGTESYNLKDNVPWNEKKHRWKILNDLIKPKLITILGPTASGKSDLAIKIAKEFNGEIISADSRQIYKEMNIGTGKITKKEMQSIPHYLLDIITPKKQITIVEFKEKAEKEINNIIKKGKIPILCGGTGFYIQSITENLILPKIEPDKKLRKQLEKKSIEQLFKELKKLDPRRAKQIDSKNKRRLIRALEIIEKTKKPTPELKKESKFNNLYIGIKKENLQELIKKRTDKMIKQGLKKEVKNLIKKYGWTQVIKNTIGYQEFKEKDPIKNIKLHTIQFAKRQMTWFKKNPDIHWINNYKEAKKIIKEFFS